MRQSAITRALSRHRLAALVIVVVAVLTGLGVGVILSDRGSAALAPSDEPLPSATPTADLSETASPSSETGSPSASTVPTAGPTPTSAAPTISTATEEPTASPAIVTGFRYADILRVDVNGLAVREAPSRTSPLAQGYRPVGGTVQPTGDVRLDAGYFVSVHLGPLRNGDTVWYLVWPANQAVLGYDPEATWWDSNGDFATVGGVDPGWVAGAVGEDQFLTLYRQDEPSEMGENAYLVVSGTGDYDSQPLPRHDLWGFNWAVAVDDNPAPCAFSVTLVPEGVAEPVVVVETSTTDVEQGPVTGAGSQIYLPWGPSAGGTWDSFGVSIRSGCAWAVGLWLHGHD